MGLYEDKSATVDLRPLKILARDLLPPNHPVRRQLEGPDFLPRNEAIALFQAFNAVLRSDA